MLLIPYCHTGLQPYVGSHKWINTIQPRILFLEDDSNCCHDNGNRNVDGENGSYFEDMNMKYGYNMNESDIYRSNSQI